MMEKQPLSAMFIRNPTFIWLITQQISVFISHRSFKSWLSGWSSIHVSRKASL